ncbi:Uncharacterized conserved protein YciI, contains a putative active-site phosphohistidine [Tistlia consotensis]|uniref:Uncharacterized conserved protein YciI, contains a putative active-site phosphohistidine n=1 Tax=Tistlia consotensis USBA 355 TaxID=560819 RepID=A0A1Y6B6U5_9PROT|nr:hypothetical protein [Tistlia consotensis]SME88274.1 Uncharacterized conserved protein YciI, contains a putative active-site phosphohistidine [Tistlia consotensis USBA 355]SNR24743.1 Uncharacterized conserved protein YciI, contains a putative active-site phosphohistidine [Tistlia consotensis]
MFIVLLKFTENRAQAPRFLEGHKAWIQQGLQDGVFLLVGSLKPEAGGAILAHGASLPELEARLAEDPFVGEKVVSAEILEIAAARTDARLSFLLEAATQGKVAP